MRLNSFRCGLLVVFVLFQVFWLLSLMKISPLTSTDIVPGMLSQSPITKLNPIISNCTTLNCSCHCKQTNGSLQKESNHFSKENVFLLVVVLSSISGLERRNAARETWVKGCSNLIPKVLVKFSIGTAGLSDAGTNLLKKENGRFDDLLLLDDLEESYHNLSLKVLKTFAYIDKGFDASYIFKADDDTFVLLDEVLKELVKRDSKTSLYWGYFNGRARVKKKGKWKETDWFLSDYYLPYALGGGYALSGDLVHHIASNAYGLQLYHSEDVSVGVWLSGFSAERRHDVRFNTEFVSRGCRNVYLVSHKQSVKDMRTKYDNIQRTGKQCDKEYQTRLSYIYNWTVPPSECCKRQPNIP